MADQYNYKACPKCGKTMKDGYIYGRGMCQPFWIPVLRYPKGGYTSRRTVTECGGFYFGKRDYWGQYTAPLGLFPSVPVPPSYYCPDCKLVITRL